MLNRREFLKNTMGTSAIAIAAGCGILMPVSVMAAWDKGAFLAKKMDVSGATASDKIKIKAPDIAENGAVVPVTISTTIPGVTSISMYVEKNGQPLTAVFKLGATTEAYASTRVKMGTTSNVIAVIDAGGKHYKAHKEVKVTIGGCGG